MILLQELELPPRPSISLQTAVRRLPPGSVEVADTCQRASEPPETEPGSERASSASAAGEPWEVLTSDPPTKPVTFARNYWIRSQQGIASLIDVTKEVGGFYEPLRATLVWLPALLKALLTPPARTSIART